MVLIHVNIDPELLQRSHATADEEGLDFNDYVLAAIAAQVATDNARRSTDGSRCSRRDPGE